MQEITETPIAKKKPQLTGTVFQHAANRLKPIAEANDSLSLFPEQRVLIKSVHTTFAEREKEIQYLVLDPKWLNHVRTEPLAAISLITPVTLWDPALNDYIDKLREPILDHPLQSSYTQFADTVQLVLKQLGYLSASETLEDKHKRLMEIPPDPSHPNRHHDPKTGEGVDAFKNPDTEEVVFSSPDLKGLKVTLKLNNQNRIENCMFTIMGDGNKKRTEDIKEAIQSAIPALKDVFNPPDAIIRP